MSCIHSVASGCAQHLLQKRGTDFNVECFECGPSDVMTASSLQDAVLDDVKPVDLMTTTTSRSVKKVSSPCRRRNIKRHDPKVTKNVPPEYALCTRGCHCKLCFALFKSRDCQARLIRHVKQAHPKRATPDYLRKVAADFTLDKIIGKGMYYCDCTICRPFLY